MITARTENIIIYSRCSFAMNGIKNINLPWDGVVAYIRNVSDVVWLYKKLHGEKKRVLLIIHPRVIPAIDFMKLIIKNLAGIYPPSELDDFYNVKLNIKMRKEKSIKISYRDRNLLKLIVKGGGFYSLSKTLGVPVKTLYSRRKSIYTKLGLPHTGNEITDELIYFILDLIRDIDASNPQRPHEL